LVVGKNAEALELYMTFARAGPGMPVDLGVSRRISMY